MDPRGGKDGYGDIMSQQSACPQPRAANENPFNAGCIAPTFAPDTLLPQRMQSQYLRRPSVLHFQGNSRSKASGIAARWHNTATLVAK